VSADTHYEVLGVEADAPQDEIKAAYRRLSRQVHPDQGGSGALFRKVTEAYETLSDPARRAAYDDSLRAPRGQPEPEEPPEEAPGWVRVDDAAPGWPGPDDPAPPPGCSPTPGADGNYPGGQAGARSGISRLFALHPAGFLVGLGLVLIVLTGSLPRARMSHSAWNLGDGPDRLCYAATSFLSA